MVALLVTACRPSGPPTDEPAGLDWVQVPLPPAMTASSLAATATGVLVGGRGADGGPHPVLLRVDGTGVPRPVVLRPHSPYAEVAELVSVAVRGERVLALGAARGGAHSNVRWTVWSGSAAGLDDRPQTFETFGGQSAGGLLDVVFPDGGPVVVGTWSGSSGLDAAVWRPRGRTWVRESSRGTSLANTPTEQVGPRTAAAGTGSTVIAGSLITFADGVRQQAAVWRRSEPDGGWELLRLPDAGAASEASSVTCAEQCWAAGRVDGTVALWRLDPRDGAGDGPAAGRPRRGRQRSAHGAAPRDRPGRAVQRLGSQRPRPVARGRLAHLPRPGRGRHRGGRLGQPGLRRRHGRRPHLAVDRRRRRADRRVSTPAED